MINKKDIKVDLVTRTVDLGNVILDIDLIVAAYERIKQTEGIELAKNKGTHMGRPKLEVPVSFIHYYHMVKNKELTAIQAANKMNISRASFYRLKEKYEAGELNI